VPNSGLPPDIKLPASLDPRTQKWHARDAGIRRYKVVPEDHLKAAVSLCEAPGHAVHGLNLLDAEGRPTRRLILIGNRNLGNNCWFVAWHQHKDPRCFHLKTEPVTEREYTCLVWYRDSQLAVEPVRFRPQGEGLVPYSARDKTGLGEEIVWCTYGQQVLREGRVVPIAEIIDQFYDIRHVLWFPSHPVPIGDPREERTEPCPAALAELASLYQGSLEEFKQAAVRELEAGRPRSRYLHNAVGIGPDQIIILQRHGTVEEIGHWLREEGAEDGLILDNGGSVFTWAWWAFKEMVEAKGKQVTRTGNVIFSAPDWRPPTISLIAFVLKGPPRHVEPPGTIAMAMG
jgi:hypothetical protein